MRILGERDLLDLISGATVFGCGGGGDREAAEGLARMALSRGKVRLADPGDLPGEGLSAIVGWVGGGASPEDRERVSRYRRSVEDPLLEAISALSRRLGERPVAFLASEIGPENTMVPLYAAASLGAAALDADACGRSKPEISISTTHVAGLPVTPLASVSPWGDVVLVERAADDYSAEDLCRRLAVSAGGEVAVARCPARIGRLRRGAVVWGSVSRAIRVGRAAREARLRGEDPVEAVARAAGGIVAFRGRTSSWTREEGGGFRTGWVEVEGSGRWSGSRLRVYYKNEFLVSWLDGEPYVSCPDALSVVDALTGEGLSNWVGDPSENLDREVAVVAIPAAPIWRTERGLEIFGPGRFGFDVGYRPAEEVVRAG